MPQANAADTTGEVLVLGAGLAGSFAARALAERGWSVRVIDRQPVGEDGPASYAPRVALLQPKISDQDDKPGQRLREGFAIARAIVEENWSEDHRVAWRPCGAFHAACDERGERRLRRFVDQFGDAGLGRWVEPAQTQDETGLALAVGGVVIDTAGVLRPAGLCAALLDHPGIALYDNTRVTDLCQTDQGWRVGFDGGGSIESPRVVIASALDALRLEPTRHLDLRAVRGQVSLVHTDTPAGAEPLADLRRVLCFGGYITPAINGRHTLGASFVPGDTATDWRDAEHQAVCDKFARVLPQPAAALKQQHAPTGWTGVRCTTPTRLPCAGPVERDGETLPGLYASLGHGSHGICSAAYSAKQLAETIA